LNEEDESELFREAMRDVRPLGASEPAVRPPKGPAPKARFTRAERAAVLRESLEPTLLAPEVLTGDELQFRRPGVPEAVLRELRRGRFRIEAELDLHGLNAAQAGEQLRGLLQYALSQGLKCLRIVHGKGLRSGSRGPVLKQTVNSLLRRADPVLAFTSARPEHGGTGATLVLLGKAPPSPARSARKP
jgi:DNA-nicking Smr family endonuclease